MVTDLTIMDLSRNVRMRLVAIMWNLQADMCIFSSDFRNKFGALHQSYTPNKERELYSECRVSTPALFTNMFR